MKEMSERSGDPAEMKWSEMDSGTGKRIKPRIERHDYRKKIVTKPKITKNVNVRIIDEYKL